MKTFARLLRHFRTQWKNIAGALVCTLIIAGSNVAVIPVVGQLARAIGGKDFFHMNIVILSALGIYFLRAIATYGQGYLMSFAAQRVTTNIRVDLFRHLQYLSLDFYARWKTGEVISRATNDLQYVQDTMSALIMETLPGIFTFIGVSIYLFFLDWRLMILTIVTFPIILFTMLRFGVEMRRIATHAQQKLGDISAMLQEKISGARVVKAFSMEKQEIAHFEEQSEQSFWLSMKTYQIEATQRPIINFLQAIGIIFVIWFGGYEVVTNRMQADQLMSFFAGLGLLIEPISVMSRVNMMIQRALAGATRVFEILDIRPTVAEKPGARELPRIVGRVELRNVTFRYDGQKEPALSHINFSASPGEIVALVGPSGAGKSTLTNLLIRFYDPQEGAILLDGLDIRDVQIHSLRQQIGIVPQDTHLFSGTVAQNVAYGKGDASAAEIEAAARTANAHQFIQNLPNGYDTLVGERGIRLSGGERQRVAIARAILRDPRILILDEATSHLDAESEKLVQEAMNHLMNGRTTFIIAHRLSTVQRAHRVLVLDHGELVEIGTHKQLLARNGLFRKLYDIQFASPAGVS